MKKIALFLLIFLIGFIACKKDNTSPFQTKNNNQNTTPIFKLGTNKFTFTNCKASNITIIGTSSDPWGGVNGVETTITIAYGDSTKPNLSISTQLTKIGKDSTFLFYGTGFLLSMPKDYVCTGYSDKSTTYTYFGGLSPHNNYLNITKYDTIGGLIEGNFKCSMSSFNVDHPEDTLNLSGQFSVKRIL